MRVLAVQATNICNFSCLFCIRRVNDEYIDLNLLRRVLKELKELNYNPIIGLTGGEVCHHPEFNELIEIIIEEGFNFGIASNGYEYERYIPLLKYEKQFKYIAFSLDGGNESIHDSLRKAGSFQKVIQAIKYFSSKVDVKTSICLSKKNINEIESFTFLSEKLGAKLARYLSVTPTGKNSEFVLADKEKSACYSTIEPLRNKVKIQLDIMSSLRTGSGANFCSALGVNYPGINPKGELIFCCDTILDGAVLGSLKENTLDDLIVKGMFSSLYLKKKRKEHIEKQDFFEGFNTCIFCNKYLAETIQGAPRHRNVYEETSSVYQFPLDTEMQM